MKNLLNLFIMNLIIIVVMKLVFLIILILIKYCINVEESSSTKEDLLKSMSVFDILDSNNQEQHWYHHQLIYSSRKD